MLGGAQVHDDGLVDLLPQVRAHDLDEGDLERGDFACHKQTRASARHLALINASECCLLMTSSES